MVAKAAEIRSKVIDLGGWVCTDQMTIEDVLDAPNDPTQTRNGTGDA